MGLIWCLDFRYFPTSVKLHACIFYANPFMAIIRMIYTLYYLVFMNLIASNIKKMIYDKITLSWLDTTVSYLLRFSFLALLACEILYCFPADIIIKDFNRYLLFSWWPFSCSIALVMLRFSKYSTPSNLPWLSGFTLLLDVNLNKICNCYWLNICIPT